MEQGRKSTSGRKVGLSRDNRCTVALGSGKWCGVAQVQVSQWCLAENGHEDGQEPVKVKALFFIPKLAVFFCRMSWYIMRTTLVVLKELLAHCRHFGRSKFSKIPPGGEHLQAKMTGSYGALKKGQ